MLIFPGWLWRQVNKKYTGHCDEEKTPHYFSSTNGGTCNHSSASGASFRDCGKRNAGTSGEKNKKWTPEFINTSLEKVKALFPLLQAEEGGFRPLKIGITRDVTDFIAQNPDAGLTLPEWQCAARIITRRWKYLERISVPGALRYGIDGLPAGVVSEHEAQHARAFLASKLASKNKNVRANNKSAT
uniref:ProQ/FinO domain-containing protein n=1 Tax=Salmonella enterica subsp. salamae TaxID=59202 RepID=I3W405_SALER|nr:hypothetical protein [Salmonella enterica subsp. salamae]